MIAMLGLPVVARAAHIDESQRPGEAPSAYLERITREKLEAIRGGGPEEVAGVLVADTIVVAPDGAVLGKPVDEDDATAMIERLADATHSVSTRFLLAELDARAAGTGGAPIDSKGESAGGLPAGRPIAHAQTVTTRVTLRSLSPGEARAYAATGEGRDKAGGYAVQGLAAAFITRIEGSYTSVVGLPLCEVVVALRELEWL
jgi:septum formation protein